VAVHWPSRLSVTNNSLTVLSSGCSTPSTSTTPRSTSSTADSGFFRDKLKTRIFQEEDRLPLRLGFFCGLAAQFTSSSFYYDDDNGSCLRSLSGLLDKARFFWDFTAAPLRLQLTRSSSQLLALRQSCFDLQPGSTPVNIGRPLDLQVGVWVLSVLPFPHPPQ